MAARNPKIYKGAGAPVEVTPERKALDGLLSVMREQVEVITEKGLTVASLGMLRGAVVKLTNLSHGKIPGEGTKVSGVCSICGASTLPGRTTCSEEHRKQAQLAASQKGAATTKAAMAAYRQGQTAAKVEPAAEAVPTETKAA